MKSLPIRSVAASALPWFAFFLPCVAIAQDGVARIPPGHSAGPGAERPNVVLIMVDDLGYADFGCYGSEIETPNIDRLAADGLRFTSFFNTAKCHSSRVSLLTGLYCNQAGSTRLNRGVTIAEVLARSGYATAMVGKWHLDGQPTDRGFGRFFGHLSGATNCFVGDDTFRYNGEPFRDFGDGFYTTDANIRYARQFVAEMQRENPERPFFLYIAHNAPHYPLQVPKAEFEKYRQRYRQGWDAVRDQRIKKQRAMGLYPAAWNVAARPQNVPAWETLSPSEKDWESRRMAAYAGMVDRLDQATGELIAYLKSEGLFENTLIMICSDNGACPFDRTRGAEFPPWDPRSYWCYDTGWAHVGNTPFRLYKQNQHQGGIASPLIVHWPRGLKTASGTITPQVAHVIDFMATCTDVADAEYPATWPERDVQPLVGKSLVPIFEGKERTPHDALYFQFQTNRAIRAGKWKLVSHRASAWELYDMVADGTETVDVAAHHPDIVKRLARRWHALAVQDQLPPRWSAPVSERAPPRLQKSGRPETRHRSATGGQ